MDMEYIFFQMGNYMKMNGKNNSIAGCGIYYYSNGDKYEDQWKNDLKEGYGILYFSNGNRFEGESENDELIEENGIFYNIGENIFDNNCLEKNSFSFTII